LALRVSLALLLGGRFRARDACHARLAATLMASFPFVSLMVGGPWPAAIKRLPVLAEMLFK
jgi:hypothetical protein